MRLLLISLAALLPVAVANAQTASAPDLANMSVRPGSWAYAATAGGSEARFMDSSGVAPLAIRCTRATRAISFSIRGVPATSVLVTTSSASRAVPASYDAASVSNTVSLLANDPLLDSIAFSRGRVAFTIVGSSSLVVPAWPEPARAIEDCRN